MRCFTVPWYNDPTMIAIRERRARMSRSDPLYKSTIIELKKQARLLRIQYYKREADQINDNMIKRQLEKAFRRARQQETVYKSAPASACPPEALREYFEKLFNSEPPGPIPIELESLEVTCNFIQQLRQLWQEFEVDASEPSVEELETVLKKLKNGKAASDAPPELLKYAAASPLFTGKLHRILVEIWGNPANVPKTWGECRLSTLYKNECKRSDPSKYRPLSIGSYAQPSCQVVTDID